MKEDKDENHYLEDRYYGSFRRTFQLPGDVDQNKAEATFSRGVLKITIPKVEEAIRSKLR